MDIADITILSEIPDFIFFAPGRGTTKAKRLPLAVTSLVAKF